MNQSSKDSQKQHEGHKKNKSNMEDAILEENVEESAQNTKRESVIADEHQNKSSNQI